MRLKCLTRLEKDCPNSIKGNGTMIYFLLESSPEQGPPRTRSQNQIKFTFHRQREVSQHQEVLPSRVSRDKTVNYFSVSFRTMNLDSHQCVCRQITMFTMC